MASQVLIVDDDPTIRADMIRILKASDPLLEIVEASDGVEALKTLATVNVFPDPVTPNKH